jgi:hypothetical protein
MGGVEANRNATSSENRSEFVRILRRIGAALNPFSKYYRHFVFSRLSSAEAFEIAVMRERHRVDRHGGASSVLIFGHDERIDSIQHINYRLAKVLLDGVRFTDLVGWHETGRIGVLLSDADEKGVEIFTDRICRELGSSFESLRFQSTTHHVPRRHPKATSYLRGSDGSAGRTILKAYG